MKSCSVGLSYPPVGRDRTNSLPCPPPPQFIPKNPYTEPPLLSLPASPYVEKSYLTSNNLNLPVDIAKIPASMFYSYSAPPAQCHLTKAIEADFSTLSTYNQSIENNYSTLSHQDSEEFSLEETLNSQINLSKSMPRNSIFGQLIGDVPNQAEKDDSRSHTTNSDIDIDDLPFPFSLNN